MSRREGPVVTLDGPAGSGKSSTAREVAHRLGFRHLDSGALYRALTWALLDEGRPQEEWPELTAADLAGLGVGLDAVEAGYRVRVGDRVVDEELRAPRVTERVSHLAGLGAARDTLLALQREAGAVGRLVTDGRDMGTVVFPGADLKVFLVADLEERARRRLKERGTSDPSQDELDAEARRLQERDDRDTRRALSPLERPDDAWELDTTELSFDEQVAAIVRRVRRLTPP